MHTDGRLGILVKSWVVSSVQLCFYICTLSVGHFLRNKWISIKSYKFETEKLDFWKPQYQPQAVIQLQNLPKITLAYIACGRGTWEARPPVMNASLSLWIRSHYCWPFWAKVILREGLDLVRSLLGHKETESCIQRLSSQTLAIKIVLSQWNDTIKVAFHCS